MKLLGFAIILTLVSCTFKEYKNDANGDIRILSLRPWYTNIQANIIGPKCATCHFGPGSRGKSDFTNYESVMRFVVKGQPDASHFYLSLTGVQGNMPLDNPPLDPREIQIIADWIKAGAPLNEEKKEEPPPEEVKPNYPSIVKFVLQPACYDCHSEATPSGDVDLTSYEKLFNNILYPDLIVKGDAEASLLYKDIKSNRMPWQRTPLSDKEKKAIFDWIQAGAKETE
ncbi:MAG: c-type cytochrome domain-containing protein [Bdellovibrionales bacterium]